MDFYQWRYDVPGNITGIVTAESVSDAMMKIGIFLHDRLNVPIPDYALMEIEWLGNAADYVALLQDM